MDARFQQHSPIFKELDMYLFAEASQTSPLAYIIVIGLMLLGLRKMCSVLSGNKIARDAAKRGGLAILRNLFK
jgi:VIT1/CCC1 family predicted Fe2+/Mn2+ transporter